MSEPRLAAILYGEGEGPRIDDLLVEIVAALRSRDFQLAGAIQHNTDGGDRCRCDMTLEDLSSGHRIDISERRGPEARGCRLDSFALEESVGLVTHSLSDGRDLLVVNRFGKREAEGHGFRQAIEKAMELGVPVLVAVSVSQQAAWEKFTAPFAERLPADASDVVSWCERLRPAGSSKQELQQAASPESAGA